MVKRLFALLLLAIGLLVSAQSQSYHFIYDCQYDTGSGQTSWSCTDESTYCDGIGGIGASIDYIYKRCNFPSCGYNSPGLKQCYRTSTIDIDYTCGGSDQCEPYGYLNGGYTKIVCTSGGVEYAYYDCCTCGACS